MSDFIKKIPAPKIRTSTGKFGPAQAQTICNDVQNVKKRFKKTTEIIKIFICAFFILKKMWTADGCPTFPCKKQWDQRLNILTSRCYGIRDSLILRSLASHLQVRCHFGVLVSPTKQMCNFVLHNFNMCIAVVFRSAADENSCRVLFALPPLTWEFPFDEFPHSILDSFSKQIFGLLSLDHIHYIVPQVHVTRPWVFHVLYVLAIVIY